MMLGNACISVERFEAHINRQALPPPYDGMYVWDVRNRVGECPLWDAAQEALVWIDVRGQAVLRLHPASGRLERWMLPEVVGAAGIWAQDQLLLALQSRLAVLDTAGCRLYELTPVADEPAGNRLNEGKWSPSGQWFVFGSMDDRAGAKQPTGSLYRYDRKGGVTRLFRGLAIANGLAWSADHQRIYFSDSHQGVIFQAAWNEAAGSMGEPSIFAHSNEAAGRPDGALVDRKGNYVSAGVSAACINMFEADGRLAHRKMLPIRAPTMPCIDGLSGERLFVTSLVRPDWKDQGEPDGALLEIDMDCLYR